MQRNWEIRFTETIDDLLMVEELQRIVWPGSDMDVVPAHLLITAVHNGGLVLGAYVIEKSADINQRMVGFVFGFPGFYQTPDGPRPKHCSHMLAVHPDFRGQGIGFALKRAQWQMVRHQGIDRISWTYDPLLSRNAYLNVARLGAVCNTYLRKFYGEMRDGLNVGLPSDRFEVDWWVNTQRVKRRLSKTIRTKLDYEHFAAAQAVVVNPVKYNRFGWPKPSGSDPGIYTNSEGENPKLLLVEIPADFLALKEGDLELAKEWRQTSRVIFEGLFNAGYLVTDFVRMQGETPRSYYVLTYGEGTF